MLRKRYPLIRSRVKSAFTFHVQEDFKRTDLPSSKSLFRDPATLPLLQRVADSLRMQGFVTSAPQEGKACHGAFHVDFPDVRITVIALVERHGRSVTFNLRTWPSQSFSQRLRRYTSDSDTFKEWTLLCLTINNTLVHQIKAEELRWLTFKEAEDATSSREPESASL